MGIETAGAAAIFSALLGAGTAVKTSSDARKSNQRIAKERKLREDDQQAREFQEVERQKVSLRKQNLFESQAQQQILSNQARGRGIDPNVQSSLSKAILNPEARV